LLTTARSTWRFRAAKKETRHKAGLLRIDMLLRDQ